MIFGMQQLKIIKPLTNRSTRNGNARAPLCPLRCTSFLHKFAQALPSGYQRALVRREARCILQGESPCGERPNQSSPSECCA